MRIPLYQHRDLVQMLVARNLKIRYKGSALGFLWSLLTPLAMIAIYAVFAGVLGSGDPPRRMTGKLLRNAMLSGERDNVTVICAAPR